MKKIVMVLLMLVASNALAACSSAEKVKDEKREVSSEVDGTQKYESHLKYLNQVDKIR
jgi:hypothetical protein